MAYTPNLSRYWNYFANITKQNNNGYFIPKTGYFVVSGSVSSVMGGTTGSVSVNIDSYAIKLKRFEAFHSGSATSFDIVFQNATPNTGSSFDPRKVIVTYKNVAGSPDYTSGVDQIEDLVALTDTGNNFYINFIPNGSGSNTFIYLIFFESAYVYV